MKTRLLVPFALALAFLAGCSLPQAQPDPTRYYVLAAAPVAETVPAADEVVIGLRGVEVASYLRARALIVRQGANEVEFREYARWGEALDAGVARVLRENLRSAGATQVATMPFPLDLHRDYDVSVRVLAAEGGRDGAVHFRATWELWSTGAGAAVVARGEFAAAGLSWDGRAEAGLVAGLSQAVAGLSAEIATAVGQQD